MIDTNKLIGHIPDIVISQLPETEDKFQINTIIRIAHFLSQCSHESQNFTRLVENLNYSAAGLRATFPHYFPTDEVATHYERQQEKIANHVYCNRNGNHDEASGDGYKFRGRGYIQLTGRTNYTLFDSIVPEDVLNNPDLLISKYPLLSAAFFWNNNHLNTIADKGSDEQTIQELTKKINGGLNGLTDRIEKFKTIFNLLSA